MTTKVFISAAYEEQTDFFIFPEQKRLFESCFPCELAYGVGRVKPEVWWEKTSGGGCGVWDEKFSSIRNASWSRSISTLTVLLLLANQIKSLWDKRYAIKQESGKSIMLHLC